MAYRGLASWDSGDRWKCPCCYTGNDDGDHCQECHATRDGEETQECVSCSEYKPLREFTTGTSTCDACLDYDQDLRFHTETDGRHAA